MATQRADAALPAPTPASPPTPRGAARPVWGRTRRRLFAVLVLVAMFALCAPFFVDFVAHDAPQPVAGQVSYRGWGPLSAPVEVEGEWTLVWRGDPAHRVAPGTTARVPVPGNWEGVALPGGGRLPGQGVASLSVTLRDLPAGRYTFYMPIIFGATRIYVNDRLVAQHGTIGATAATTTYEVRSSEIPIETNGAPVSVRVEIASFHHRDTGVVDAPIMGLAGPMQRWTTLEWGRNLLFQASLLLLAANSFIAFLFRPEDRASLFLALTMLVVIPATAVLSHDNLLLLVLPWLPFPAMLAIQYFASSACLMLFLAYAAALFPKETTRPVFRVVEVLAGLFLACQMTAFALGDTLLASRIAVGWPLVIVMVNATLVTIVARATIRGRDGALVFLLGIGIFCGCVLNAALLWSGLVPPRYLFSATALSLGTLALLFSHFVVIAERWSVAILDAEQVNGDLRQLLEVSSAVTSEMQIDTLLQRIVETTSGIVNADRSSLLLHDPATGELVSRVAEGIGTRELRFSSSEGIAGHAFTHGEVIATADAYADPRFVGRIDDTTGYRTRSMLTMPVATRDGRRLGVMQALNRLDGRPFDDKDAQRMAAFAAQAAIALDNATLFQEVVASRNYSESILRSMSSGVITLDREGVVARLNVAAGRMLGIAPELLEGVDPRRLLAETNPWLLDEMEQVIATGEPKLILDHDMIAGGQRTISVNISIVPLLADGEPSGLLLLLEDISEGKRLQGTMRRFMTQKVVDQVLAQQEDILFGTACDASVLFADIRNFTTMAEKLSPRETVDMLNEAFTDFFEAVSAWDGVLDKFIGDAIMAVYGAPLPTGRDPENAVESGLQMLRLLAELNRRRAGRALPPLRLGIGVATGEVVAGTIGSPKRMDYTVIGDSVNLAARIQDLTKVYGVEMLVCEATAAAIAGKQAVREVDLILVRGRARPSKLFQVFPAFGPGDEAAAATYARGRERLGARDWQGAVAAFAEAAMAGDGPSTLMLARARALAKKPPAEEWNGVWSASGAPG